LTNHRASSLSGHLILRLTHLDRTIQQIEQIGELVANTTLAAVFTIIPPPRPLRGYGLDATLYDDVGHVLAEGSGALAGIERWAQAPRYGFLSDFAPGQAGVAERCASPSPSPFHSVPVS